MAGDVAKLYLLKIGCCSALLANEQMKICGWCTSLVRLICGLGYVTSCDMRGRLVNVRARARRTIAAMNKNMDKAQEMVKMFGQQAEDSEQRQEFENQTMDWRYELAAAQWEDLRCSVRIDALAGLGCMCCV